MRRRVGGGVAGHRPPRAGPLRLSVPTAILEYRVETDLGETSGEIGLNAFLSRWASDLIRMSYLLRPPPRRAGGGIPLPVTEDPAEAAARIPSLYRSAVDDVAELEGRAARIWRASRYQLLFPPPPGAASLEDRISRRAAEIRSAVQAFHLLLGVDLGAEISRMEFRPVGMSREGVTFSYSGEGPVWIRGDGLRSRGIEEMISSEREILEMLLGSRSDGGRSPAAGDSPT